MTAYYNEHDPYAAAWLRNLIAAGHIAPGDVDKRDIRDVRPSDIAGFDQCHFFAGIGVWSYALRLAGWPDDRPVWTGSCPCQPFSAAGKGGGFADERHLWPAFFHLIGECRPAVVLGEQVASRDGLDWLDLVQDDMEGASYAFGAVDTSSALHGAPHIRQRLRWVAHAEGGSSWARFRGLRPTGHWIAELADSGAVCGLADANGGHASAEGLQRSGQHRQQPEDGGARVGLGVAAGGRQQRFGAEPAHGEPVQASAISGGLANDALGGRRKERADLGRDAAGDRAQGLAPGSEPSRMLGHNRGPGPTNSFWRDPDWLFCRDGRWRPVEPGAFPLAHGAPARVGRLRAYGNAVDAEATCAFVEAVRGFL